MVQVLRRARQHRVQDQRRQGEVIDRVGLVPIAEIRQVFGLWHIGFGQQDQRFGGEIGKQAHQAHNGMGAGQVDAVGADLFPDECHSIEPQNAHAVFHMQADDRQEFGQHLRVGEIQIDLIMGKGAPYMTRAAVGFDPGQQGVGARAHHHRQVIIGGCLDKEAVIGGVALTVGIEPVRLAGHMVHHQIGHQQEFIADAGDVGPVAQHGVHGAVIGHRETVIGCIGKERQDMHAVDHAL